MRILLTLKSLKDVAYDKKYYSKLRGFLYGLQQNSSYFNKHQCEGYKFYSFSNFFPAKDLKEGDKRNLIISSPDRDFIYYLYGKLADLTYRKLILNIGEMQFSIEKQAFLSPKIHEKSTLITGTPIILRIPKIHYKEYSIQSKRPYEYWRPEYDFNAFINQMYQNLIKKYIRYYGKKIKVSNPFEQFKFKKSVCVHRIENGQEQKTIGSIWEFRFSHLEQEQRKLVWLGLESGFGELNSSGFGFMNVMKNE